MASLVRRDSGHFLRRLICSSRKRMGWCDRVDHVKPQVADYHVGSASSLTSQRTWTSFPNLPVSYPLLPASPRFPGVAAIARVCNSEASTPAVCSLSIVHSSTATAARMSTARISVPDAQDFRAHLTNAKKITVLTGAGVSAASGVPTFRGAGGLWRTYSAMELATPEAFAADPSLVWEFYHYRRTVVASCQPNDGHISLAELERHCEEERRPFALLTQNIDGLHAAAGSKRVIELHGSLWETRCVRCSKVHSNRDMPICKALEGKGAPDPSIQSPPIPLNLLPRCPSCSALLRPNVVWFGEQLHPAVLAAVDEALDGCNLPLVIGTSGVVYPSAFTNQFDAESRGTLPVQEAWQSQRGRSLRLDELAHFTSATASAQLEANGGAYQIGGQDPNFVSLTYQGGRILSGAVPVYPIYYGNWPAGSGHDIMENFINSINDPNADGQGTSVREWFNLHKLYKTATNAVASTNIYLAGTRYVSLTANLNSDYAVADVVCKLQSSGNLPYNNNALFAVLTPSGIKQQYTYGGVTYAFCTYYCGWHNSFPASKGTTHVNVIYIGWAGDCNCAPFSQSVNNNNAMDGMVSSMAHEIIESITDVDINTFRDMSSGDENAGGCAWFFLGLPTNSEPYYNTYGSNGMKFLVQSNMHPTSNTCVHGLDIPVSSPPLAPPLTPPPLRNPPPPPTPPRIPPQSPPISPSPPPPVLPHCAATSSSGSKCRCAAGTGKKDGCVCSKGVCVSFCSANNGKKCKACTSMFCKCKSGKCKPLFSS